MRVFIQNLPMILLCLMFASAFVCAVYYFYHLPTEEKREAVFEWLKLAVFKAEKEYGGKTGQIKLREVWNQALQTFPWLIKYISFEEFSVLVDRALVWMHKQIEDNHAVYELVYGRTA